MHLVFVFGTLKRGFANHVEGMARETFVGRARTVEAFPMLIAGRWFSPVMIPEPGNGHRVFGELYEVGVGKLEDLDRIESVHRPDGYRRHTIRVENIDSGATVDAQVYMKERRLLTAIHSDCLDDYQDRRYVHKSQRPPE